MAQTQRPPDPTPRQPPADFSPFGVSSSASSRTNSPAPTPPSASAYSHGYLQEKKPIQAQDDPGCRPMDVYDVTLPPWRAAVRRALVKQIRVESVIVAKMQDAIRSPWLDKYFVYTSALGTHTFFLTFLPMLFFFGFDDIGHGLINVLCLGIYFTSVLKDLFCSPRPFAPPVTRMTIGNHHLEYGMPSTHCANAISLALFLFGHIHELAFPADALAEPALSLPVYAALTAGLVIYTVSIVFGRLYTAMHSFSDCTVGFTTGAVVWIAYTSFRGIPLSLSIPVPTLEFVTAFFTASTATASWTTLTLSATLLRGWGWGALLDAWVLESASFAPLSALSSSTPYMDLWTAWRVPLTLIPLGLLAVNQHPQPVDDCPCFEDAIAFGSVVLGMYVGQWGAVKWGLWGLDAQGAVMPGSGWVLRNVTAAVGEDAAGVVAQWVQVNRTWADVGVWWGFALAKMVFGILTIFAWRLLAKALLHRALPPTFRFLATHVPYPLPHRRFYTPATDYTRVPTVGALALHPVPSVIDLPSMSGGGVEVGGIGSGSNAYHNSNGGKKARGGGGGLRRRAEAVEAARPHREYDYEDDDGDGERAATGREVKRYDADVLTKLIVYAGIGVLACEIMPVLFERFGWGVRSWGVAKL
ncbi:sphingosine-1-phosphate phosphatase [Mycena alexandri]|uniref:Sphingosine-1-phosphate phosphatase n=1 Tax=Mycena alexandri TaxID=1745969 RepID=A0AAD6SVG5_9AGAR|nr:sphingosine-1-phosphate phosphatase [Mycena alexandri]